MPDAITNIRPILNPIWPWPVVLCLVVLLVATVVYTYPQRVRHLRVSQRRRLLGLRYFATAMLVWAMFRPSLILTESDDRSFQFMIGTDVSRSMGLKDGPGGTTRLQAVRRLIEDNRAALDELNEQVEIVWLEFAESPVSDTGTKEPTGDQTAYGFLIGEVSRTIASNPTAFVLLMGDGAQRALPPFDLEPRTAARAFASQHAIPIHTLGVGSPVISGASLDLVAENLMVNPTVFVKNEVVVRADIRILGAPDRDLVVKLLVEDFSTLDSDGRPQMKLAAPPLKISTDRSEDLKAVELSFVPENPGEYKMSLIVEPIEGELLTDNNVLTTYLSVLKGGLNVAYFDKARTEVGKLRQVSESPDIQLDFKWMRYGGDLPPTPIERDWFNLDAYDVYIIGDVPASVMGVEALERLEQAVRRGAGLLMTGGFRSFGPGGYANSPLHDLLPVKMYSTELQSGDEIDLSLHIDKPLVMLPTAAGRNSFVLRLDTPWNELPPLQGANKLVPRGELERVLAETEDKIPLLISQEVGRARVMAFAADTTYLWWLGGKETAHQQFWRQMILWLAHKETQSDRVWVNLNKRRFRRAQPVDITFGANDEESRPMQGVDFQVTVKAPDGTMATVATQRSDDQNFAKFIDTADPGEYTVSVNASKDGKPIDISAQARFYVYEQDLELYNPAADLSLLKEIAQITGGRFIRPEEFADFLSELDLEKEVTRQSETLLWDNWILLALFVTAMTAEWFLRKSRGLV